MAMAGTEDAVTHVERQRARAFRAARRHTAIVRVLKVGLPVGVVAALGLYGFMLFGTWSLRVGPGTVKVASVEVTADDLKMKGVNYAGAGKDGSRYQVRAREAAVDMAQTGPVKLAGIDGDLTQTSGVLTKLKAVRGSIDNKSGEMELLDGVEIDSSNGLKARMKSAKVFNKENRVVANEGVVADLPTGRIQAQAMEFETKTKRGVFAGQVAVRLTQDPAQPKAAVGLGKDARAPVDVRAPRLDIDDSAKVAVFTGGTVATQGESALQSARLKITYEGQASMPGQPPGPVAAKPADAAQGAASRVKTLEADGQVVITSGADQRVTADAVVFDVPADTALFSGQAVEIQQGRNRLLGRRLTVDRKNGRSRLDAPAEGRQAAGRIQTTFYQAEGRSAAPKPVKPDKPEGEGGALFASSFKADPNAPTDIVADTLDINDPIKQAIWRGKVRAQHGDVLIETPEMAATYTGETGFMAAPDAAAGKAPGSKGGAQLSKIDARGGVVVTSKDGQQVTGQWATFDMKANSVLVGGGARALMGRNSTAGEAIRMDLDTGMVEVVTSGGRLSASDPATGAAPKSAVGPGGLPAIPAAKVAPPPAPTGGTTNCPPGRTCLQVFPEDRKKLEQQKKGATPADTPTVPKSPAVRVQRPSGDGWEPQSSPSPVYRN